MLIFGISSEQKRRQLQTPTRYNHIINYWRIMDNACGIRMRSSIASASFQSDLPLSTGIFPPFFLKFYQLILLFFDQELPLIDIKTDDGRRLKDLLARVHYITSHEAQDKNFWTILQLGLPLQKKSKTKASRDSLENLV